MKIDLHIHTIACGHAYSTFTEIFEEAARKKLDIIAVTEHGPAHDPKGTTLDFFNTYRDLPNEYKGVRILKGCEVNILTDSGDIDLPEHLLKKMDIVIASMHTNCRKKCSRDENTEAYINAIKNPYIDIIGHPDDINNFPYNPDPVVDAALKYNVALEINNSSPRSRPGSEKLCSEMLEIAVKKNALLSVGSDSHYHTTIGEFKNSEMMIDKFKINRDNVLNYNEKRLFDHLKRNKVKTGV